MKIYKQVNTKSREQVTVSDELLFEKIKRFILNVKEKLKLKLNIKG